MKNLIATRSIKTATQHFQEGDKFELEDKHADPLIACGAAVPAPVEPPPAKPPKTPKAEKPADPDKAPEAPPAAPEGGAAQ